MDSTTILATAPSASRLGDLSRLRPDWRVVAIGTTAPEVSFSGPVFGFVDLVSPQISGLELCRRLRAAESTRRAHLTLVLDQSDEDLQRRALAAGADDYLIGPLDSSRLLARIAAPVSENDQTLQAPRPRLMHGGITLDRTAHQVRFDGRIVALRPNEFRVLAHFIENPDQVISREALIERLGKHEQEIDARTVDVWIGRLRRALIAAGAPDPLRTVRSLGYVLDSVV